MKCHQPEVAAPGPVRTYPRRQREVDLTGTGSLEELLEPRQPSPELVQVLAAQVVADYRAPAEDVERIRRRHAVRPLSAFALRPDKHHLLVAERRGLVAYAVRNAVAVACDGPLCAPEDRPQAIRDFLDHGTRHGWWPSFYGVPGAELADYAAAGLKSLRIGDEGMLDPRALGMGTMKAFDWGPPQLRLVRLLSFHLDCLVSSKSFGG